MRTIRGQIWDFETELGLLGEKIPCAQDEIEKYEQIVESNGELPDGIFWTIPEGYNNKDRYFFKYNNYSENREKIQYLLTLQRTKYLRTIKNCVMFFTIAAVIGIVAYIFTLLSQM